MGSIILKGEFENISYHVLLSLFTIVIWSILISPLGEDEVGLIYCLVIYLVVHAVSIHVFQSKK